MVREPGQAVVESAELGFRACLDDALRDDGSCGVVSLATGRVRATASATDALSISTSPQCNLVAVLLWPAQSRAGIGRYRGIVDGAGDDDPVILESATSRGRSAHPVFRVDYVRRCAQLRDLEAQPLIVHIFRNHVD